MAQYEVGLRSQGGTHKYNESTRTLHITIDDIFDINTGFGTWCYDNIKVTSLDTKVSVVFKPWEHYAHTLGTNWTTYDATYEGESLFLNVWLNAETRDRMLVLNAVNA